MTPQQGECDYPACERACGKAAGYCHREPAPSPSPAVREASELRALIEQYANAKIDLAQNPTHESAKAVYAIVSENLSAALSAPSVPPVEAPYIATDDAEIEAAYRRINLSTVPHAFRPSVAFEAGWKARAALTKCPAVEEPSNGDGFVNGSRMQAWLTNGADIHPLTANLVVRFARALASKLAAAEKKYGYSDGWRSPDWMDECRQHLMEHIAKGDPRDVAAYCAFLWHHGEPTARDSAPVQEGREPVLRVRVEKHVQPGRIDEIDVLKPLPAGEHYLYAAQPPMAEE